MSTIDTTTSSTNGGVHNGNLLLDFKRAFDEHRETHGIEAPRKYGELYSLDAPRISTEELDLSPYYGGEEFRESDREHYLNYTKGLIRDFMEVDVVSTGNASEWFGTSANPDDRPGADKVLADWDQQLMELELDEDNPEKSALLHGLTDILVSRLFDSSSSGQSGYSQSSSSHSTQSSYPWALYSYKSAHKIDMSLMVTRMSPEVYEYGYVEMRIVLALVRPGEFDDQCSFGSQNVTFSFVDIGTCCSDGISGERASGRAGRWGFSIRRNDNNRDEVREDGSHENEAHKDEERGDSGIDTPPFHIYNLWSNFYSRPDYTMTVERKGADTSAYPDACTIAYPVTADDPSDSVNIDSYVVDKTELDESIGRLLDELSF